MISPFQSHPEGNVVADTLSRKPHGLLASLVLEDWKIVVFNEDYDLQCYENDDVALIYNVIAKLSLLQHAKETQWEDAELREIWNKLQNGVHLDGWSTNPKGFLYYKVDLPSLTAQIFEKH